MEWDRIRKRSIFAPTVKSGPGPFLIYLLIQDLTPLKKKTLTPGGDLAHTICNPKQGVPRATLSGLKAFLVKKSNACENQPCRILRRGRECLAIFLFI